ncbi:MULTISPECIES: alpha/beta fold hydrolase [Mycolicibacterium]|uniref:Predicted hydrolase or acyltransferase of alpha/beta superfamily n=3 Tax=Mycolicibacterium gilvum TaxID=1804 RepID=E6TDD8_MYCSR|nr:MULTISPECIES: alpha/beta hydrolase [Mycolicibacterium]ABP47399.1 alpha/beta hydrolase fold protein [Mycolicibacterium gilvum PYR-GCK]ADU00907.1 predicted hydrolase or acyltransferase of alpha/beta superfamily [Mycolicibacterium gilvum Spyr1]MBV5242457.1 alpha/beta hydrolase [Mycolicibacterium sp. PAM1]MCV7056528.1 alpha/beta hydrolase [Mycolicibacterium gilvum]STZ42072.1 alpha/beta hydrolase fold protein [Mycolicibacterium gilvum]
MSRGAGWLAGAAGVAAVGSAAGVSMARSLRRRVTDEDPHRDEDFELLDADRSCVVTTSDGVPLAVREVGPEDAPLTVVFAHGFCLRMGSFHFQRVRLTEHWGAQVRMVFFDQRGHGQSGDAPPETYTVEQLGRDLEAVLAVMAPKGPVVLVGHSMGGMAVLSHARQYPQRYPTRVVGAALISSAAEGVARSPVGEILKNPALEAVRFTARYAPKLVHRGRGAARSVIGPILRAASYGDEKISPSVVAFSERMMHDTPIATLVEFLHALEVHDETAGLETLRRVPTLVACGDRDLLTPKEYSQEMADVLAKSELVIVPGAGHLVQLECPEVINDALVRLVERATPSKLTALTRRVTQRVRSDD